MRRLQKITLLALGLTMVICTYGKPTEKDVQVAADQSTKVMTDFLSKTLTQRLTLHHIGFGQAHHNDSLCANAQYTQSLLTTIYQSQKNVIAQIEEYEGDDWDALYGETELWSKAVAATNNTQWFQAQVQLWQAIGCREYKSQATLEKIIELCNSNDPPFAGGHAKLLAAQAHAAMKKYEPDAIQKAFEILNRLSLRSDISSQTVCYSVMLRSELTDKPDTAEIKDIYDSLRIHGLEKDFELNMRLALALLKTGNSSILEKTLNKWPGAESIAGEVILSSLSKEYGDQTLSKKLNKRSILEATLATNAAIKKNYWNYEKVLMSIAEREKFQTPGILINIAQAQQKFSPGNAIENYLRAAEIRKKNNPENLESTAEDIALHGALLACELSKRGGQGSKEFAKEALAKYYKITGEKADGKILYYYATLLKELGDTDMCEKVLKVVSKGKSEFAQRAELDLLAAKAIKVADDPKKRNELIKELTIFIYSANHADKNIRQLRQQGIALCTGLLIKNGDKDSAKKVITMLDGYSDLDNGRFIEVKTAALEQLGAFSEAVELLSDNIEPNSCGALERPISILTETLRQIEHLKESNVEFPEFIDNCCKLAEHCLACPESGVKDEAALLLAELLVLSGDGKTENLQKAEQLLKSLDMEKFRFNIDYMRTMARLLTTRGDFRNGLRHWKAIVAYTEALKERSKQANIHWWQGQYYSILCFSKLKATTFTQTDHAIEVLLNSGLQAPPFWAEKLEELKKTLRQQKLD